MLLFILRPVTEVYLNPILADACATHSRFADQMAVILPICKDLCGFVLRLMATFANSVCSSCCPQGLGANAMFKALDERIEEKGLPFAVSIWSFAVDTCWSCVSDFNLHISVMPIDRKKLSQAASLTCSLASVPMRRAVFLANPSSSLKPVGFVSSGFGARMRTFSVQGAVPGRFCDAPVGIGRDT